MTTFPLSPLRLVVLISGGGTTLKNLIEKIQANELDASIELVISNKPAVQGLTIAEQAGIATAVVDHRQYANDETFSAAIFERIEPIQPHLIAMGGFLRRLVIPPAYRQQVTNIHPGLIPAFLRPRVLRAARPPGRVGLRSEGLRLHGSFC